MVCLCFGLDKLGKGYEVHVERTEYLDICARLGSVPYLPLVGTLPVLYWCRAGVPAKDVLKVKNGINDIDGMLLAALCHHIPFLCQHVQTNSSISHSSDKQYSMIARLALGGKFSATAAYDIAYHDSSIALCFPFLFMLFHSSPGVLRGVVLSASRLAVCPAEKGVDPRARKATYARQCVSRRSACPRL